MCLINGKAKCAQFGQLRPCVGAVLRLPLQNAAHVGAGRMVGENAAYLLLKAALVFAKIELHRLSPYPRAGDGAAFGPKKPCPFAAMSRT